MRIYFLMRHLAYLRLYEASLLKLARRGHTIELGLMPLSNKRFETQKIDELVQAGQGKIHYTFLPPLPADFCTPFKDFSRSLIDYLRYFVPEYENAHKLRARMAKRIPVFFKGMIQMLSLSPYLRAHLFPFLRKTLSGFEDLFPVPSAVFKLWTDVKPDLVLFTPLLDSGMGMLDYAKGAKTLGIRTALCVASWDNLTNKGLIQADVDKIIVWNQFQKEEAIRFHHIPDEKIELTGAQVFDEWFDRRPKISRKDFCEKVGLDERYPVILYLCSSVFIAKNETDFVKKWVMAIRNSPHEKLRSSGILIRPHPANVKQWLSADLSGLGRTVVWPAYGAVPIFEDTKDDYFHSLYYADVAVGLNTSAMIESGILGKTVLTLEADEFKDTQEGTLHYHYLVEGGLLRAAKNMTDHLAQISEALEKKETSARLREFIEKFLRPYGMSITGTEKFIAAVEALEQIHPPKPISRNKILIFLGKLFLAPWVILFWIGSGLGALWGQNKKKPKGAKNKNAIHTPGGPIGWNGSD